jgi:hypothetical protein
MNIMFSCVDRHHHRRGALLLIVLGTLTLFLLVGTVMLTLATRARQTSRAFAAATAGTAAGPMRARVQLEEALLRLIRGNPVGTVGVSESLLGDMYGGAAGFVGEASAVEDNGIVAKATVSLDAAGGDEAIPPRAADLCGRILTFKPVAGAADPIASYRVLRASGTGPFTCWLVSSTPEVRGPLPQMPCPVVINPPAFRDEAYDAFDDQNAWLTQLELEDGAVVGVPRPAFAAAGAAVEVDNDNDGLRDGVWLENFLEPIPAPGGGELEFDVSYLVLDLDSRVNVNAHGSRTSIDYPASSGKWKNAPAVPTGSGYGPADVDASLLFVDPLGKTTQSDPPVASDRWRRILGDGNVGGLKATASSVDQRRAVPQVGSVQGRYGDQARPGLPGLNDSSSERNELVYDANPLVDLQSMMRVEMDTSSRSTSAVPKMRFFSPAWSSSNADWARVNYQDDPYEMRLDDAAPRPMEVLTERPVGLDNPYTLPELEAVLRQCDSDANTLPPRLAVALDDFSQRSRLLLTTDSWDTPALTGPVAQEVADYVASLTCDPAEVMSPDVLAGLRFDLNRPFPRGAGEAAAKQEFCKHLFTLLVALGQPADAATAQWAANVVDYRDPDSKYTRFEFDTNPSDGWDPSSGNVVWGVERPEVVIAQTLAWRAENVDDGTVDGGLYVTLYRPWAAELIAPDGSTRSADVLDAALRKSDRDGETDVLDLSKKSGNDPIWRLRFDEPSKIVRFDIPGNADREIEGVFRSKDAADLRPDSYLVVMPNEVKGGGGKKNTSVVNVGIDAALQKFVITQGGTFKADHWAGAGNDQPGSDTMVFLERLADPALPLNDNPAAGDAYNPYVVVDQLGIKLVNRSGVDPNNWRSFFRDPPFWRDRPFSKIINPPELTVLDPNATNWLPWANRAFVSHAELLLVPQGDALGMLSDYDIPKNRKDANPYYFLPSAKLLEATIVPSRFVGSQMSVDPADLAEVGLDKVPYNQLSRWREPGRVNLNTVVPNRYCADPQRDDAVWWAVLGPDAAVSRDEYATKGPAKTLSELLTLLQDPHIYIDTAADAGVKGNSWKKNRPYDLNPAAAYSTAIRLANVATIRSHVFAVWITLRVRDSSPGAGDTYHRVFAIVDRSRPVAYAEGQNLNVRDTIRVIRYLE